MMMMMMMVMTGRVRVRGVMVHRPYGSVAQLPWTQSTKPKTFFQTRKIFDHFSMPDREGR